MCERVPRSFPHGGMTPGRTQKGQGSATLGHPRVHLRRTDSTNERARALAVKGSPHGTLVSAAEQTEGRGRQGRAWVAPAASALLCSLVLRDPPPLLSLIAGVAVCDAVGNDARVKWPNDVVLELPAADTTVVAATPGRPPHESPTGPALAKLAGILVEGRPQEGWAVLGIGVNVAVRLEQLPADVRAGAASLELPTSAIEPLLEGLLEELERRLSQPVESVLKAWRARDCLRGRDISWGSTGLHHPGGHDKPRIAHGRASGIDDEGRLIVELADGSTTWLDAGEIHLRG
jgi:BirA family biotin operon repressor/biotin-[acetyl-CoA-carboxylase] ligase